MVKRRRMPARAGRVAALVVALAAPAACTPEIVDTTSLVAGPALLAVAASPAEARPGEPLALRALAVGPDGPAPRALDWALCTARAPLTSPGVLAPDCLGAGGDALVPLGVGAEVAAAMPANVCQTFGPDQPAPRPGQPAGRPADPDPTGGYYQPVRIVDPDAGERRATASFEARALCHVAGATPEQQAEFDRSYRLNENPSVAGLALDDGTPLPSLEGDPAAVTAVAAGATLTLRVTWPDCRAVRRRPVRRRRELRLVRSGGARVRRAARVDRRVVVRDGRRVRHRPDGQLRGRRRADHRQRQRLDGAGRPGRRLAMGRAARRPRRRHLVVAPPAR